MWNPVNGWSRSIKMLCRSPVYICYTTPHYTKGWIAISDKVGQAMGDNHTLELSVSNCFTGKTRSPAFILHCSCTGLFIKPSFSMQFLPLSSVIWLFSGTLCSPGCDLELLSKFSKSEALCCINVAKHLILKHFLLTNLSSTITIWSRLQLIQRSCRTSFLGFFNCNSSETDCERLATIKHSLWFSRYTIYMSKQTGTCDS